MAVELHSLLIWGLAFTAPGAPPWHGSEDVGPDDSAASRLERRATLLGRDPAEASGCLVGEHFDLDRPMAWVAIEESYRSADDVRATNVRSLEVGPDWEDRLRAFCEICEIPWSPPSWVLLALRVH